MVLKSHLSFYVILYQIFISKVVQKFKKKIILCYKYFIFL
jgi:hypothetical protein